MKRFCFVVCLVIIVLLVSCDGYWSMDPDDYSTIVYTGAADVPYPNFTSLPCSVNIASPDRSLELTCAVSSDAPLVEYQWYRSPDGKRSRGTAIEGETCGTLTIPPAEEKGVAYYFIGVKNIFLDGDGGRLESPQVLSPVFRVAYTGLPTVVVETDGGVDPSPEKEYRYGSLRIYYHDGYVYDSGDYDGDFKIKVRGNATATYPKAPYKLKLPKKANLIDHLSPKDRDKDWVLLANYCDKTLLRTQMGFSVASMFNEVPGNEDLFVPGSCFVDVVLNGEYLGVYNLVDAVEAGPDRVAVNEKPSSDGGIGYVSEFDPNYYKGEDRWFRSELRQYPYTFKFPETDDPDFDSYLEYYEDLINEFERSLYDEGSSDWQNLIDIESFARWFLVNNVLANIDTNYFISKRTSDSSSKLTMGPVWDFEWSIGIGWYDGKRPRDPGYWCVDKWYFEELLKRQVFVDELKRQWRNLNETFPDLAETIIRQMDGYASQIDLAQELNFRVWRILDRKVSVGGVPLGSYEAELECDRQFLRSRIGWLDSAINAL